MTLPAIVIPSHKRAGKVKTLAILPTARLCVAESQADEYRDAYPEATIDTHPDRVAGLLSKRQWIMEQYGDVLMLDDDINDFRDITMPGGTPREQLFVRGDALLRIIERAHDTAEQLGAYLWGFTDMANPLTFDGRKPYALTGYVRGSTMGIRPGSKLWFNPEIVTCGGLWISLLNMHHHRIAFRDLRYGAHIVETGTGKGGMSDHRTRENYRNDKRLLDKYFGSDSTYYKRPTKQHGVYDELQITMKVKW